MVLKRVILGKILEEADNPYKLISPSGQHRCEKFILPLNKSKLPTETKSMLLNQL